LLGEDTRAVLRAALGYSDERIDELARAGVIACNEAGEVAGPAKMSGAVS